MTETDRRTDRLKRRSFVRSSELRLRAHSCHSQLPRPRVLLPRSRVLDEACRHRCSALYLSIYGNSSLPLCLPVCLSSEAQNETTDTDSPTEVTDDVLSAITSGGPTSRPRPQSPASPGASNPIGPLLLLPSFFHSMTSSSIIRRP